MMNDVPGELVGFIVGARCLTNVRFLAPFMRTACDASSIL
jgi:hypothetical protein